MTDYIRDGDEIYRRSFAIIRAEADLARFNAGEERVAVRDHPCLRHARRCARSRIFAGRREAGIAALQAGAPILCDAEMVAARRHPRAPARRATT